MGKPDQESSDCRKEYAPEVILKRLGLDVPSIIEKRLLDLGCGKYGGFVHWLRKHDVEAAGIDHHSVIDSPYLSQVEASDIYLLENQYDLFIAHLSVFRLGNNVFINALKQQGRLSDEQHELNLMEMENILLNMALVARPGGRAIIAPYPDALAYYLQNFNIKVESMYGDIESPALANLVDPSISYQSIGQRLIINYP